MKGLVKKAVKHFYLHVPRMSNRQPPCKSFGGGKMHNLVLAAQQKKSPLIELRHQLGKLVDGAFDRHVSRRGDPRMDERILLVTAHLFLVVAQVLRCDPCRNLQTAKKRRQPLGELSLEQLGQVRTQSEGRRGKDQSLNLRIQRLRGEMPHVRRGYQSAQAMAEEK